MRKALHVAAIALYALQIGVMFRGAFFAAYHEVTALHWHAPAVKPAALAAGTWISHAFVATFDPASVVVPVRRDRLEHLVTAEEIVEVHEERAVASRRHRNLRRLVAGKKLLADFRRINPTHTDADKRPYRDRQAQRV